MQGSGHCSDAGAGGYTDGTFRASMNILESTGLLKLGYNLVLADDCVGGNDLTPLTLFRCPHMTITALWLSLVGLWGCGAVGDRVRGLPVGLAV